LDKIFKKYICPLQLIGTRQQLEAKNFGRSVKLKIAMSISSKLDELHSRVRGNRWLGLFALFNRIALAAGFIPAGLVKIVGDRFTVLTPGHPMGHFLDAFYRTGYYYRFVGVLQVTAGILLLIPRTVTLGAFIYFPIILNICVLSYAVRFEGSILTSPLMVLANLYSICWDFHKWKFILPFYHHTDYNAGFRNQTLSNKFPTLFAAGATATFLLVVFIATSGFEIVPRNTKSDCKKQCENSDNSNACDDFCDCIHKGGQPLDKCLEQYDAATAN
jgi:uncharacterized membrane protein YphA (DoxX/SURF4 family)